MDTSPYLSLFLQESADNSVKIAQNLLLAEKSPAPAVLTELMRLCHSCKGAAATMGYDHTAEFCHQLENVFDAVRTGILILTPAAIDVCLQATNAYDAALLQIEKTKAEPASFPVTQALQELIAGVTPQPVPLAAGESGNVADTQTSPHVRVSSSKLDTLLELSGELAILQQQMRSVRLDPLSAATMTPLTDRFEKIADDLRYHVMQSRLIPLEYVFVRFPRLVRETANAQGKKIRFSMRGTDIELDKTLVDHLATPLIHLLRNAVDHGIESSEERRTKGKSEEGSITLTVERSGAFVTITVEDDGMPLNVQDLAKRARALGLPESDIAALREDTILDLLVSGRFSSSESVSMVSGRGVGLSAVHQTLRQLGGTLQLRQDKQRKQFILTLPLRLSVIQTILVRANNQIFGLPFLHIHRILDVQKALVQSSLQEPVISLGGQEVPLVFLEHACSGTRGALRAEQKDYQVLIAGDGQRRTGLCVDEILRNEEVMVSSVPSALHDIPWLSGCALLGDGSIALIVDIPHVLTLSHS